MLNGRIYRAALAPFLLALAIAAFSLEESPAPLSSTLAPDAFDGARAFAQLRGLAAEYPHRRPGSAGDAALAARVVRELRQAGAAGGGEGGVGATASGGGGGAVGSGGVGGAGGGAGSVSSSAGGTTVAIRHVRAQTIDGERTLTTVIATRPGSTGASPIVLVAHRDAAGGGAAADLSGTAVLLELARVFAASETRRTIVLVSTSGGSGGDAGAADYAAHLGGGVDAAIVLGDLAGARARRPLIAPFSDGLGGAPVGLQRTVSGAISQEAGVDPGTPSALSQLAHLTLPLTAGEEGPLNAAGAPAVLVQVSGERDPSAREPLSEARLTSFGRAVLSAVYALDGGADVAGGPGGGAQSGVLIQHKTLPEWAVRLLVATLLLAPLLVAVDGLARLRRRRVAMGRWLVWVLACALPFALCALFMRLLGLTGVLAAPGGLVLAGALPGGAAAWEAVLVPLLVLALAWLAWPVALPRLGLPTRASSDAAGLAVLFVLLGVGAVVWLVNPYTALLLVPAAHLWLLVASPGRSRGRALALVALGALPLLALVAYDAHELGFSAAQMAQAAVLLLAGGYVSLTGIVLWSLAFGCLAGAVLVALGSGGALMAPDEPDGGEEHPITIRGPMSYAGPGSLGGTESALR